MFARRKRLLAVLLLGVLVTATGCSDFLSILAIPLRLMIPDTTKHKAEYKIGKQSVVVIPFKDQRQGYFQSRDGVDLAAAITGDLISRPKLRATVKDPEQVRLCFGNQDLASVGWQRVGQQVGADLVMVGELVNFSLKRPGDIGFLQGNCQLKLYLIKSSDGSIVWSKTIRTIWPKDGSPTPASDIDLGTFRQQLISWTSLNVAQCFYDWEEPIGPPPRRTF